MDAWLVATAGWDDPDCPRLKQRLKHDQQQILTATRTELSFAHPANDFYDPALDGLPPSVSHT